MPGGAGREILPMPEPFLYGRNAALSRTRAFYWAVRAVIGRGVQTRQNISGFVMAAFVEAALTLCVARLLPLA